MSKTQAETVPLALLHRNAAAGESTELDGLDELVIEPAQYFMAAQYLTEHPAQQWVDNYQSQSEERR